MYRKDYIQRQFEEFGKVLASLLLLKRQKNWQAFEVLISEAFRTYGGLDGSALENLSLKQFETELVASTTLSFQQKKILANLLFEKMNLHLEKGDLAMYEDLKQKCLLIYQWLQNDQTEHEFDLDVHYKLKVLSQ